MPKIDDLQRVRNQKLKKNLKKMEDPSETFIVRDARQSGWHWVDNVWTDVYACILGPCSDRVYNILCRYADQYQRAWPTVPTMAKMLGYSHRQIIRAIKDLEEYHIIRVFRSKGVPNAYQLQNKASWKRNKQIISLEQKRDAMTDVWDNGNKRGLI